VTRNGHAIGPMEDIMDVLYITNVEKHLNKIDKQYVHKETKNGTQINAKNTVIENKIFNALVLAEFATRYMVSWYPGNMYCTHYDPN